MARLFLLLSLLGCPLVFFTLPLSPADLCGAVDLRAGTTRFGHAGLTYVVTTPRECLDGGCGLIVDLHGATMRVAQQETELGLARQGTQARRRGAKTPYVVVQPQAGGDPPVWTDEDAAGIFAATTCVAAKLKTGATHLGGFSQGAAIAAEMLCEHPSSFASFSAIAGGADALRSCLTRRRSDAVLPPILYIHGRRDPLVPFSTASKFLDAVRAATGKSGGAEPAAGEPLRLAGNGLLVQARIHDAAGGLAAGHCIPGGQGLLGCAAPFSAGEQVIDFYIANTPR
jgi:polyhydroxybutyrate depolymerase